MNILLVEPGYTNKYPPLGLMKISHYHKLRGDVVKFVKGCSQKVLRNYWDRVYISSLFTFDYKITVDTLHFYKAAVHSIQDIYVGGILASLMPEQLRIDSGIDNIIVGQLSSSTLLGFNDDVNIDCLSLDYGILDEIEYKYPAGDNYFAYTTRGCPNSCKFCAVPILEPEFKTSNHLLKNINEINEQFGEKRNLLLMDNNILNSPDLVQIVNDIKNAGFYKGATFTYPNKFMYFYNQAINTPNNPMYIELLKEYIRNYTNKFPSGNKRSHYTSVVSPFLLGEIELNEFAKISPLVNELISNSKDNRPKQRYIDFNQGVDARLLTEEKMQLLSQLPIKPLRIAFDSMKLKNIYINVIHLAKEYGIKDISNYILFNYTDTPIDLWERLKINIELSKELNIDIFSFPMKYVPINQIDRRYIGKFWKKKYLDAISAILLVTKGIVARGDSFFYRAFGSTREEFSEILAMPRDFIIYRNDFEQSGLTNEWKDEYRQLKPTDKDLLIDAIQHYPTYLELYSTLPSNMRDIVKYYFITHKQLIGKKVSSASEIDIKQNTMSFS
jgi:hypothetical protein